MHQWAIRSEASFRRRTSRDCKGWGAAARPCLIFSPAPAKAESSRGWRGGNAAAGELLGGIHIPGFLLHVQTLHAEVHRSVGEPAEGSLPRVASKPRPLTVTKTLGGVAQQCEHQHPPVPLSPPTRQHRSELAFSPRHPGTSVACTPLFPQKP